MNLFYETLIIIAVAILWIAFASSVCFKGRDDHYYIRSKDVEVDHYILKKTRFLFLFAYALTWNWKTGIIRKSILRITCCFYLYFLLFYVADVVYYIVTSSCMIIAVPIIWVIFAVIAPLVLSTVTAVIIAVLNKPKKVYDETIGTRHRKKEYINSDDNEEIK